MEWIAKRRHAGGKMGMLARLVLCALFCTALIPRQVVSGVHSAPPAEPPSIPSPWKVVGEGITYREFYLSTPNHVYVARLERGNPQVIIESGLAQGALRGGEAVTFTAGQPGLETVRNMALRYDQTINFWGEDWGQRSQVVAAINGFFYDTETGLLQSGLVHSAWYAKRFDERQNGSGFAWTLDRQAFIGGCITHPRNKQVVTLLASGEAMQFDDLNALPQKDGLTIFTPQYGAETPTQPAEQGERVEALVELNRPLLILPAPAMITGTVRMVSAAGGQTALPFDHIVLSGSGEAAGWLRSRARPGVQVGISQELRHFQPDCRTANPLSWSKTYAASGASFVFLRDGVIQSFSATPPILRTPRTAVAFNDRYIFFIVVDGRDSLRSLGMGMVDLAVFARNQLGATWGAALDGGGSSTMVINGQLENRPNTEVDDPQAGSGQIERAVASSLMMVVVQPRQQSQRFQVGGQVITLGDALLRLGPGTNYAPFANLLAGRSGEIVQHSLNGVLAKGMYWWKVAFGDVTGWISEDMLSALP